jgi:TonB family protein
MTDIFHDRDGNPSPDLAALHEELSAFRYEERPSFSPELRAELARAWAEEPARRRAAFRRHLAAATLAGLLVGGASVPSARASFVRLVGVFAADAVETEGSTAQSVEITPGEPVPQTRAPLPPVFETPRETTSPTERRAAVIVAPEIIDRGLAQDLLGDAYPRYLQRQGVGGTVGLRVWVDEFGLPGAVEVSRSSGVRDLDRAAREAAPRLTFTPALQDGRRVGTWIEFPVLFDPDADETDRVLEPLGDPLRLPDIEPEQAWQLAEPLHLPSLPERTRSFGVDDEVASAERSLAAALGDGTVIDRFGPARVILQGEPPEGVGPTRWRAEVGSVLERAIDDGIANPASLLALGRIRLRQGLRTEARAHFERGLQRAVRDGRAVSSWVVAELHHERGTLIRESWLSSDRVGRVHARAFAEVECAQARSTGGGERGFASSDRLIAWNYLCPRELTKVFEMGFEEVDEGSTGDLTLLMGSFRAAIDAYPGHVGANTDLLMTIAAAGRWDDLLSGARRFVRVSEAHPNGLLLAGLALHRLDRPDEAAEHFYAALERMPEAEAGELTDVGVLLDRAERRWYRSLPTDERRAWETEFWKTRDRSPPTTVNARWVEHMARAAFAQLRFGGVFGDAAEVWIRFGEPKAIHRVDEGSGRLTEFWDYGSGPDITFLRVSSKRTELTPEGRAYVDDLGKIIPPQ